MYKRLILEENETALSECKVPWALPGYMYKTRIMHTKLILEKNKTAISKMQNPRGPTGIKREPCTKKDARYDGGVAVLV